MNLEKKIKKISLRNGNRNPTCNSSARNIPPPRAERSSRLSALYETANIISYIYIFDGNLIYAPVVSSVEIEELQQQCISQTFFDVIAYNLHPPGCTQIHKSICHHGWILDVEHWHEERNYYAMVIETWFSPTSQQRKTNMRQTGNKDKRHNPSDILFLRMEPELDQDPKRTTLAKSARPKWEIGWAKRIGAVNRAQGRA